MARRGQGDRGSGPSDLTRRVDRARWAGLIQTARSWASVEAEDWRQIGNRAADARMCWALPSAAPEAKICLVLADLVLAVARQTRPDQRRLFADLMLQAADHAERVLAVAAGDDAVAAPAPAPDPQPLPFRADIDG